MSNLKLEIAVQKIEQIEKISKLKEVEEVLQDETFLKPAIMKHFDVICQQFEKLKNDQEYEILSKFSKSELEILRQIQNWSLCEYDDIQNETIKDTILNTLPKLKESIKEVLKDIKLKESI